MTIRKGEAWGRLGSLPEGGVTACDDADAAAAVQEAHDAGRPYPTVGLLGGDLWRTLGGVPDRGASHLRSAAAAVFPIDLGILTTPDDREHVFLAHVVARSRAWGTVFLALNAQWLGTWNVGPRAHPNDGRLDTYLARLGLRARLQVRSRLPMGAHLPHPGIAEQRVDTTTIDLGRALTVFVDGRPVGRHQLLGLRVIPDALEVVV